MDLFNTAPALPFALPDLPGYAASPLPCAEGAHGWYITVPGGELHYVHPFLPAAICDRVLAYFQQNDTLDWRTTRWREVSAEQLAAIRFEHMRWKQDSIHMYGKRFALPRLTSWYGDPGRSYTYSGITSQPTPWNKGLLYLKQAVEALAQTRFNSVLINWYRDGQDHLAWHADDEPELGPEPVIASLNFGMTRDFILRRNTDHQQKITIPLQHGTLLVMRGALQRHWQHAVPKRTRVGGSRFNLTFRQID